MLSFISFTVAVIGTVKITLSDGATAEVTLDELTAARGEGGGELGEISIVRCSFY